MKTASKVTTFNQEENLWETKVGEDKDEMELFFIAFGKTKSESKERAKELAGLLNESSHIGDAY